MTAGLCGSSRRLPALITLREAFAADCGLPTLHINIIYICFMYTEHRCSKASLFICSASLLLSLLFGTATHTAPSLRLNVAFPKQIPIRLTDNKLSYVYILSSEKKGGGWKRNQMSVDLLVCLVVLQARSHQVALGGPT